MREEQARRECGPNQSPNTRKAYRVRAPFAVSIDFCQFVDLYQFDFEDQSSVWWDYRWEATSPVGLQTLQIASCNLSLKLRT
jgi:hypothetical protein